MSNQEFDDGYTLSTDDAVEFLYQNSVVVSAEDLRGRARIGEIAHKRRENGQFAFREKDLEEFAASVKFDVRHNDKTVEPSNSQEQLRSGSTPNDSLPPKDAEDELMFSRADEQLWQSLNESATNTVEEKDSENESRANTNQEEQTEREEELDQATTNNTAPFETAEKEAAEPEHAKFNTDAPADSLDNDALNRGAISEAIAQKVVEIWPEQIQHNHPFIVHLSGRWGSGKTSILNFLCQNLRGEHANPSVVDPERLSETQWIVVKYNAWRRQKAGTAPWALLNSVYEAVLENRDLDSLNFRLEQWRWRIFSGRKPVVYAAFIAITVLASLFLYSKVDTNGTNASESAAPTAPVLTTETETTTYPLQTGGDNGEQTVETVKKSVTTLESPQENKPPPSVMAMFLGITTFLASIGGLVAFVNLMNARLKSESDAIVEIGTDPTNMLKRRFENIVRTEKRPIAIFIDDLDRCDAAFVVEVLQTIQSIYCDVPVLYVIAADKDWLVSSYEQHYKGFTGHIQYEGQSLGQLFMEKIFQLSVSVPNLSTTMKKSYLQSLVNHAPASVTGPVNEESILAELRGASDESDIADIARKYRATDAADLAARLSFTTLQQKKFQSSVEHLLVRFANLMDPNPRAIKRAVNAYSFKRGMLFINQLDLSAETLAKWCILESRFPAAAVAILKNADLLLAKNRTEEHNKAAFHSDEIDDILQGITSVEVAVLDSIT